MKRVILSLVWFFAFALVCSAQTTFYFPHVADGAGWKTTIFLTNPGGAVANGDVRFTASSGAALDLAFVDENGAPVGAGNMIPFSVAAGQTRKFVSTGAGAVTVSGFATVNALSGTVTGTAAFSFFAGATLTGEAGVPAAQAVARQAIFVDLQGGFNTGVAYANPNGAVANITLQLLSTDGNPVVAATPQTLPAFGHTAAFIAPGLGNALFPTAPAFAGAMRIESSVPLAAIALRFAPGGTVFTTLPPVTLASLIDSGIQWFEKSLPSPLAAFARVLGKLQLRIG
jgi:hypothetical protein